MHNLFQDFRFALRQLRRAPAFTLGVTLVLALGIGVDAAMFTVLRATLLRPLSYTNPGDLVSVSSAAADNTPIPSRIEDVLAWRTRTHTITSLAYYNLDTVTLNSGAAEQEVGSVSASAGLFPLLGVAPALGRTFTAAEQQPGHEHVLILSDSVWRTHFHADPSVGGRTLRLNDDVVTVIGVMPRGFSFPVGDGLPSAQVWQPVPLQPDILTRDFRQASVLYDVIARRSPGSSVVDVTGEISAIQQTLVPLYGSAMALDVIPTHALATDFRHTFDPEQRQALLALSGAVLLLWLIACANVASLQLARAAARRREVAVRSSLGATRWQLARGMLAESLLLNFFGGLVGIALAQIMLALFHHRLTQTFGLGLTLTLDHLVLFLALAFTLLSTLLSSAVPTFLSLRGSLEQVLRSDGTQAGVGTHQGRLHRLLITGELALTLCLLVSCGLLIRTVVALGRVPLGFRTDHVFSITPHLPYFKYSKLDPNALVYRPLAARLRSLPGVDSLAITSVVPLANRFDVNFLLTADAKQTSGTPAHSIHAKLRAAGPEFREVLGFRMAEGRFFNAGDTLTSQPVAVVNRAFAREYAATGQNLSHFTLGRGDRTIHIVGVVDDFHQQGIAEPAAPEVDLNAAQLLPTDAFYQPTLEAHAEILLRSSRDPRSLLPELRHALTATNPDLAAADIQTMDQIVEDSMGSQLLAAHLLETLGALALLIALAGLYSLLAYLVTLRTRELGLRLALGARRSDILTLVLRNAASLLLIGIAAGLLLSLAAARLLRTFLFGVHPHDTLTLITAPTLLLAVGLLAAFLPARRAAHLEPTTALRSE